jgi:hypothetical protein
MECIIQIGSLMFLSSGSSKYYLKIGSYLSETHYIFIT